MKKDINIYLQEFLKCKNDFFYFCDNYGVIELPGGDVKIQLYERQKDLIRLIQKENNVVCLKSRQIGISTIIQLYCAYLVTFYKNVIIGIISKDGSEATSFARHITSFIDKLPKWIRPKFKKRNEQSFFLSNGCKCYSAAVNPIEPSKTLRGKAITFLVIDEASFVNKIEKAWTGLVPALATSQKVARENNIPYGTLIISTPNGTTGTGKWFFEKYTRSLNGEDIFKECTIHWKQIKELANDPNWFETQKKMFDSERQLLQELELQFISNEGSFFLEETIKKLQENTKEIEPIEKFKLFNGEIWKFADAIPGRNYIIGVDTAPENGEDKSALTIFDYETLEQVYEFRGKCQVSDFIKIVKNSCAHYPGVIVIENNSYGNQVVEEIRNSEYSHMLYKEKRGDAIIPGVSVNTKTRPLIIESIYTYITQFPEIIKSKRLAMELISLEYKKNGKVEAASGTHDDIALSMGFCFYVRKYDPPMMINHNTQEHKMFVDIIDMNNTKKTFENYSLDELNRDFLKNLKEEIFEEEKIKKETYYNFFNLSRG
ncbi:MAG: Terminase-like family protein [candidate division CPR1 bacterium ADurb.Bin160]|uniref:Terminase-like family protein n=1 Tax=candidate division CPR1 bacterium ADurb.Bin160 TaxID=1852826 RepID=A0A1V5ZNR2_9BACT|nr:MAG: Terminase-like family protein [candidate division CPR1 bacterium ADurb.Bin160]